MYTRWSTTPVSRTENASVSIRQTACIARPATSPTRIKLLLGCRRKAAVARTTTECELEKDDYGTKIEFQVVFASCDDGLALLRRLRATGDSAFDRQSGPRQISSLARG